MIDIHAHILPGVDDGPKCLEEALALVAQASKQGVTDIIATPHYHLPSYDNYHTLERFEALKGAIESQKMPISIHLGNEVYADELILTHLNQGHIHTLAKSRYVLLELPFYKLYPVHHDLIFQIQKQGYKVILAHVERYNYFKDNPQSLVNLVNKGCYGQLSADYVVEKPKEAKKLIECGLIHVVASDMHSVHSRPNTLGDAQRVLAKQLNESWAKQLTEGNPEAILKDEPMKRTTAQEPKKSWFKALIS